MDPISKFKGGIIGSAIGDAIGELAFLYKDRKGLMDAIESADRLVYTDDTAMCLGLMESLIKRGEVEPEHLGDTFMKNYQMEPWRGYAMGPPTVFELHRRYNISYPESASMLFNGKGSFGNGSAMRVTPVGLFYAFSDDLYNKARLSSIVTHTHPVGIDGACIQAKAISLAFKLDPNKDLSRISFIEELIEFSRTEEIKEKLFLIKKMINNNEPPRKAISEIGRSVAVHESMPFSIYCFLLHPESFIETLMCSVLHGGDRDTLGAMACAISGTYLGIESIPDKWIQKLENLSMIMDLSEQLYKRTQTIH